MATKKEIQAELDKHSKNQLANISKFCLKLTKHKKCCKVEAIAGFMAQQFDIPLKQASLLAQAWHRYMI